MCFMRMALDIVYLDSNHLVLATERGLKPWRLGKSVKGARMVLEAPVGTIDRCGIAPGQMISVEPSADQTTKEKRGVHGS
jgi:uncharacterized membrane protein (UPF0127 family)